MFFFLSFSLSSFFYAFIRENQLESVTRKTLFRAIVTFSPGHRDVTRRCVRFTESTTRCIIHAVSGRESIND